MEDVEHKVEIFLQHFTLKGQTEVVDQSFGDLLCFLVEEHVTNWDQILLVVEFAYNSTVNRSTSHSPFEIVIGLLPRQLLREREKGEKPYSHSYIFYLQLRDIYIQG